MTTNRVQTFDIAMLSRIHWPINFGEMTAKVEMDIWKLWTDKWKKHNLNLLKNPLSPITNDEVDQQERMWDASLRTILAEQGKSATVNGREIRNIFITAYTMANGGLIKFEYIHECYHNLKRFRNEMKETRLRGEGQLLARGN